MIKRNRYVVHMRKIVDAWSVVIADSEESAKRDAIFQSYNANWQAMCDTQVVEVQKQKDIVP